MKNNIKAEFRKPKLTLCNPDKTEIGILTSRNAKNSAYNIQVNKKVNDADLLSFDIPFANKLINDKSAEMLIKHGFDYYIIKDVNISSSSTSSLTVSCESEINEIKGILVSYFEPLIGVTAREMFNTVIANCSMADEIKAKYVFETDIADSTKRHLEGEEEVSIMEHLLSISKVFNGVLLFSTDSNSIIHVKLQYNPYDRGKFVRHGKDLKNLNININSNELFTKLFPFGATDSETGIELNVMNVNDGKSYITNYDYFLAKGMSLETIKKIPKCNQEIIFRNSDIVDEKDLLRIGQEELAKMSKPKIDANLDMLDLNVFEGAMCLSPILNEKIIIIDNDIKYNLEARITGIDINYDNVLNSKITISNVISYSTTLKDLVAQGEIMDKITTTNDGKPSLNGSKVVGLINTHIAQVGNSLLDGLETDKDRLGIIYENRIIGSKSYGCIAMGTSGILISSKLDTNTNEWVWTTALDSKGLSTEIVNAMEINANQIKAGVISNIDGSVEINLERPGGIDFKKNGVKSISLIGNQLEFYDWDGIGIPVAKIFSTRFGSDELKTGIAIANKKDSAISIAYETEPERFSSYITFDKNNILHEEAIQVNENARFLKETSFNDNVNIQNKITLNSAELYGTKSNQVVISKANSFRVSNTSGNSMFSVSDGGFIFSRNGLAYFYKDGVLDRLNSAWDVLFEKNLTVQGTINAPRYINTIGLQDISDNNNKLFASGGKWVANKDFTVNGTLRVVGDIMTNGRITGVIKDMDGKQIYPPLPPPVADVVKYARQLIGLPYSQAYFNYLTHNKPPFCDCSSLCQWSYYQIGITLSRTTYTQINEGTEVPYGSQLQSGDLVFSNFSSPGVPEHVYMYAGKETNTIVEAQQPGVNALERPFPGWSSGMRVRRILTTKATMRMVQPNIKSIEELEATIISLEERMYKLEQLLESK